MRKVLILIISISSLIISGCVTTPPQFMGPWGETWAEGGVNKEQPISIGEVIYSSGKGSYDMKMYTTVSYRYMGVDDKNNVKVIYKFEFKPYGGPLEVETFSLLLPLNPKKQTILKVISYELDSSSQVLNSRKEVLITIVDEFNRITAEEIGKTQTK